MEGGGRREEGGEENKSSMLFLIHYQYIIKRIIHFRRASKGISHVRTIHQLQERKTEEG